MASDFDEEQPHNQVTRREVLRRGAIIGGVLWASPVIQSFTSPASAGSPPPNGDVDPQPGHWAGVVTSDGSCQDLVGQGECLTADAGTKPGACSTGVTVVYSSDTTAEITWPSGYTLDAAAAHAKKSNKKGDKTKCVAATQTGTNTAEVSAGNGWKIQRVEYVVNNY